VAFMTRVQSPLNPFLQPPLGRPPCQPTHSTKLVRVQKGTDSTRIEDKHHIANQDVTAFDSSTLDDAASMAGLAQIAAERAGS